MQKAGSWWGSAICISIKFPGENDAAGSGTTFWKMLLHKILKSTLFLTAINNQKYIFYFYLMFKMHMCTYMHTHAHTNIN